MERESSPWRQPIVWLMVALVGAAVIGSVWLLKVAANGDSIDAVPDKVQRTGQTQQTDLGPDAVAAQRKLGAIVRIDDEHGFVEVLPVSGELDRAAPLKLSLHHPTRAEQDVVLELAATDTGWRVDAKPAIDHDWLLQLKPADGEAWRLRGRMPRGQLAAQLRPSVGDDAQP
ncbi:FixH family protein [Thermomonas sp. HDW16]|uniref:FixH family protein n=1 Tax=Thermomonas sp. HDW16 TaxID=2714945 RepID=UPI00140A449A|nr:FixH family protein [Thermomonas sp. HDW16]QIL20287.1 nitrogen fixation protein FixH [Thermomonas sp. HDW16]